MNKVNKFLRSTGMIVFAAIFCMVMFVICIVTKPFKKHSKKKKNMGE